MPPEVVSEVMFFRYRERLNKLAVEAVDEDIEEIERAFLIWECDDERAKLEDKRAANN